MAEADLMRELHDAYVWKINAAVEEGRMDLVWQFADEYTDEALQLMTTLQSAGCGRPECAVCARGTSSSPTLPARRRWLWWRHPSVT